MYGALRGESLSDNLHDNLGSIISLGVGLGPRSPLGRPFCPVFVLRVSFGFEIQIGGREISTTAARAVGLATAHRGRRGVYAGWLYGGGGRDCPAIRIASDTQRNSVTASCAVPSSVRPALCVHTRRTSHKHANGLPSTQMASVHSKPYMRPSVATMTPHRHRAAV